MRRGRPDGLSWTATGVTGEGGTGGNTAREGGRRLVFPVAVLMNGRDKDGRVTSNESFVGGAEGAEVRCLRIGSGRAGEVFDVRGDCASDSLGEPGDSLDKDGLRRGSVVSSKPPPTPNRSASSSASTKFSLRTLPMVCTLATEPVRLRTQRFLRAEPMHNPDEIEEVDGLRAMIRSSIARSRSFASCWMASLSRSSQPSAAKASRRRLHSLSSSLIDEDLSDCAGEVFPP